VGERYSAGFASTYQASDGMPVTDEEGRTVTGADAAIRTDFIRHAHSLSYAGTAGPVQLYTRAGMDQRDFSAFHFYTPFPSDTAREATSEEPT
jgi:vitamin B12 transporter